MVMLIILIVGGAAMLLRSLSSTALRIERERITADALAKAREALIGYAVTYGDTHTTSPEANGYLPCPDANGGNPEGSAEPNCGNKNVSQLGRLPWRTLGLGTLRDGNGECLWYAVSGTYKDNPKTDIMDWDSCGLFQVLAANGVILAGQTEDSQAVAAIFSPGTVLSSPGQNRAPDGTAPLCGGNYTAGNYLDSDTTIGASNSAPSTTANGVSRFFTAGSTQQVNDQIIFITKNDIFNAVKKRKDFGALVATLLNTSITCLATLPTPVTMSFNSTSPFTTEAPSVTTVGNLATGRVPKACLAAPLNKWQDNLLYAKCTSGGICLTVNGAACRGAVIFSGEHIASQTRSTNLQKNTWSNYLEGAAYTLFTTPGATAITGAFTSYNAASPSTDVWACIP